MHKWQNVIRYSSYVKSCPYSVFLFVFFAQPCALYCAHSSSGTKGQTASGRLFNAMTWISEFAFCVVARIHPADNQGHRLSDPPTGRQEETFPAPVNNFSYWQ